MLAPLDSIAGSARFTQIGIVDREILRQGHSCFVSLDIPKWVLPWVSPTSDVARQALAALDRPLAVVRDYDDFDPHNVYEPGEPVSKLERAIRDLGSRPQWRILERVWLPSEESSETEDAAYEAACATIAGYTLVPRCLDAYAEIAWQIVGVDEADPDEDPPDPDDLSAALAFAEAGVCVLQQSLPWPFLDVLSGLPMENRPALRVLGTYAELLAYRKPRIAGRWFAALTYMDPRDGLGARFRAPGGPNYPY